MSLPLPTAVQKITAYRHLYRGLLKAVQYSKPARYTARNQLRLAFRTEDPATFDQQKIDNTIEFLGYAAKEAGLEHKLVKNILLTNWWKARIHVPRTKGSKETIAAEMQRKATLNYTMTLAMLNDSMGLCLR
ncbi:hypothetical protein HYFRA_00000678 [Hymenoscyphus fraxineus]|uniref:DUF1763-domain-containing protein n=1 Tax=Hymenoscyphus fraxineus TaxID=746836 RepID=A0A9N9L6A2_9HELO|nr:hypothetical protein HYFRA_00000678 [Hymenoscyphus fraxineus]